MKKKDVGVKMETAQNYQLSSLHNNHGQSQLMQPLYAGEVAEPEEELDVEQFLKIARRRAVLIAGVATAIAASTLTLGLQKTPEYRGSFQLLVEPVTTRSQLAGLSGVAQNLTATAGLDESSLDYDSQIQVLRSQKNMNPIVQQLQTRYPDISYESLLGSNVYKPSLFIDRLKKTKVIEVAYQDSDPQKVLAVLEQVGKGYLKYSLEERKTKSSQGIQFIEDQLPQMRQRVDALQAQLQEFRQKYNLIDPELQGQQLAEQVTQLQQDSLEAQTSLAQQQLLYANLQRRLGLDPDSALNAAALTQAPRYQQLLGKLREIETSIAVEKTRFTEANPQIQALREQQQSLLPLILQEAQEVLGQDVAVTPQLLKAPPFQDSIRLSLAGQLIEVANTIEVLKVQNQALTEAQSFFGQQVQMFPVVVRQYTDLMRELTVATTTLTQLLGQREQLRVDAAKEDVPWEVIKPPQVPQDEDGKFVKASPRVSLYLLAGLGIGLILGLGAALLAEQLNNAFHTIDDVKDASRLPVLGVIPSSPKATSQNSFISDATPASEVYDVTGSSFLEAFRSLNANIRLLNTGTPIRSVVISSAAPADGKSTVAVHLAQAAAAMGQRVLLVDTDLRWPQIYFKLGLPNAPGLSDLITANKSFKEVIRQSPREENLFVLTAGTIPPDPLRLLSSQKMQQLMEQFKGEFDLIIYDTPPLLGLADSSLLASRTDGILIVAGIGQTDKTEFTQALQGVQTAGIPVLGIVANRSKTQTPTAYYDHRRYSMMYAEQPQPDSDVFIS